MNFTQEDFQIELENYRLGLQTILPAYLDKNYTDQALVDELALVLHSRDWLESALAAAPRYTREHLAEIEALDRCLLALKDKLLASAPFYPSFRQQAPRPHSHWWYYLDQIVTHPDRFPDRSSQGEFWLPLASSQT